MTAELDEAFATGLRAALVDHVGSTAGHRSSRWRRRRAAVLGCLVLAAVGGGVAVAAQLVPLPGGDVVKPLAPTVVFTGTGTQTVPLGTPPAGTNLVELDLSCLTAGTFTFADGAGITCGPADVGSISGAAQYGLALAPGQRSTTITTAPTSRWRLKATYSNVVTTPWRVNARGQTFGVVNDHGTPDLVAVVATNGRVGYVYGTAIQGDEPEPTSPAEAVKQRPKAVSLPVYTSNGTTVIGTFVLH